MAPTTHSRVVNNDIEYDLIVPAYAPWPVIRYELELLHKYSNESRGLIALRCGGDLAFCPIRDHDKIATCSSCMSMQRKISKIIRSITSYRELIEYTIDQNDMISTGVLSEEEEKDLHIYSDSTVRTEYNTNEGRKQYETEYKNICNNYLLGYSIASKLLNNEKVKRVFIYNARISFYRPFLVWAKKINMPAYVYEVPMIKESTFIMTMNYTYFLDRFKWSYDLKNFLNYFYKKELISSQHAEKKLAQEWFESRINFSQELAKTGAFENRGYLSNSVKGKLPKSIQLQENKKVISYFVSSDFETVCIPEVTGTFELSQMQLVEFLATWALQNDYQLIIRLHPNMVNSDTSDWSEYLKFSHTSNKIDVVKPHDEVDSYALAHVSNFVISLGSTIGLEAAYMGVRSIVCGTSHYEAFEVAHHVSTVEELQKILNEKNDVVIDIEGVKNRCIDCVVALRNFSEKSIITKSFSEIVFYCSNWKFGLIRPWSFYVAKLKQRVLKIVR